MSDPATAAGYIEVPGEERESYLRVVEGFLARVEGRGL
jgi:hypothetical protein